MVAEFPQHNDDANNDRLANIPRGLRDRFSDEEILFLQKIINSYTLQEVSALVSTLANQKIDAYQEVQDKDAAVQQQMMIDRGLANKINMAIRGRI